MWQSCVCYSLGHPLYFTVYYRETLLMAHLTISYRNGSILFLVNWQTFSDSILCGPWLGLRTLCRNNFWNNRW